jgi:alpha-tubulin suppressor-like RCC1 family protein
VSTATAVTTGRNHSCALLSDGTVVCWGSNIFGMLGNQNFSGTASYVPVDVVGF